MPAPRRLHPLDVAAATTLLVAGLWTLLHLGDARWTRGSVGAGFRRVVPTTVALRVLEPEFRAIARSIAPGPFVAERSDGPVALEVLAVEPDPDGGARIRVRIPADVDRQNRAFFDVYRLRIGEPLAFGGADIVVRGTVMDITGLDDGNSGQP